MDAMPTRRVELLRETLAAQRSVPGSRRGWSEQRRVVAVGGASPTRVPWSRAPGGKVLLALPPAVWPRSPAAVKRLPPGLRAPHSQDWSPWRGEDNMPLLDDQRKGLTVFSPSHTARHLRELVTELRRRKEAGERPVELGERLWAEQEALRKVGAQFGDRAYDILEDGLRLLGASALAIHAASDRRWRLGQPERP
eukprot:TRINITY_DN27801_c0_g1_i4.p2 TRINITY_DN27801_c0_g1~~TRINITY_DN27801_c0_g1_i4.p2  ORF type:complete len:213 (+),score=47.63 TRINITY_DN27801_c0_g1_i4:57-641(+)